MSFSFQIVAQDLKTQARLGRIQTPHGVIETPSFYFCATRATLKSLSVPDILKAGTTSLLSNTYHLMLRPGSERIAQLGGLHRFMAWDKPIFTDSGGFQIFSLGHGSVAAEIKGHKQSSHPQSLVKITEEGASFRSYWDGTPHLLTPERSMEVQRHLGSDLITVLDECTPFHVKRSKTESSMHRSHRWGLRSLKAFQKHHDPQKQALYGIMQGGVYLDLRQQSADFLNAQPFFGHAIGGSLGATKQDMHALVQETVSMLSKDRPIHLLGIGGISDIWHGVACGIDTFDCVHPTRLARHGGALVRGGEKEYINLTQSQFAEQDQPIEADCPCQTCVYYTRAYLHHLLKNREILALSALTIHNVCFMNRLMASIRTSLQQGTFSQEKSLWYSSGKE